VILLEDLVVHADHRRHGFGSQLAEITHDACTYARQKEFLRITLLTDRIEIARACFYKRHGFVESNMIPMRLYLTTHDRAMTFVDLGFARVDTDRKRRAIPEVIYCGGKRLPIRGHRPHHFAGRRVCSARGRTRS